MSRIRLISNILNNSVGEYLFQKLQLSSFFNHSLSSFSSKATIPMTEFPKEQKLLNFFCSKNQAALPKEIVKEISYKL